ncbi:dual specificity protein phosphatase CDC14A-like isoform X2 [Penaeus japonicus]|nr:dual specificity protein phosphatase CDC14A-like isoform X2 [Penaeus japonicus]
MTLVHSRYLIMSLHKKDLDSRPFCNFSWLVEGKVCGSELPWSEIHLNFLRREKVGVIVTLTEEGCLPESASKEFECHLIPVEEFEPPSLEQICEFMSICDAAQEKKKAVCVHCRMGCGRTGVMLACYLVKNHLMYPLAAIHLVRNLRPNSVETSDQEQAVCKYSEHLSSSGNSQPSRRITERLSDLSAPWNFSWILNKELCGSAWPQYECNIEFLRNEGISVVITACEASPLAVSSGTTIENYLIPVRPYKAPSLNMCRKFIAICNQARSEQKAVCVHCRMGLGRTGTFLACYLVKYHRQPPVKAIAMVREMRPGSVESIEQEMAVHTFWNFLNCV